jgi:hypothetical protein
MNARPEWIGGADPSRREAFQRALNVSNAGTVLLQTSISKVVQLITNRQLGVQSTLPRRGGSGDKFYSQRRTAAATGGSWVADTTDDVVSQEGGYTQTGFTFRTMLGRIKVTRKLIATGRSYGDVLATELIGKAEDFANDLEDAAVIGDSASNSNQIDGLLTLIGNVSGQTIANTTANGGDSLALSKLDQTIQTVKGHSNKAALRIYCSYAGHRKINNALQAQQRFSNMTEIEGGFVVESYQGIPIIESTSIPDTLTWVGASARITVFSGSSTTALIVVNTNYVFFSELTPMTVMPLAKKSSQYDEVDMFLDITLVLDNTKGAAILGGLNTT